MAETTTEERIEADYQKIVKAAPQGPEAVRKVMQGISPGKDWTEAAWELIEARSETRPSFLYEDKETGAIVHWSPAEGVLRKLLNAPLLQKIPPATPGE